MKKEILKQFDEVFGEIPSKVILVNKDGREFCSWCGHPSSADVEFKNMKTFISESIEEIGKKLKNLNWKMIEDSPSLTISQTEMTNFIAELIN